MTVYNNSYWQNTFGCQTVKKNANIKKTLTLTKDQAQQRNVFGPSLPPA